MPEKQSSQNTWSSYKNLCCGIKGIKQFASLLAADVRHYKLSEIMLFFSRFAVGRYGGNSWQSFDLRRIGIAFHQEFLPERNLELARIEREQQQVLRE